MAIIFDKLSNLFSFMRKRKDKAEVDLEGQGLIEVDENMALINSLRSKLELANIRERKLMITVEELGGPAMDTQLYTSHFDNEVFFDNLANRVSWLVGLLIVQSCSSFILSSNEQLLINHPSVVYFLTMLVGAGGNAGNQATVRVIRGIALGAFPDTKAKLKFVGTEFAMAISLSLIIGIFGLIRVYFFSSIYYPEAIAITIALMLIVFSSVIIGSILPLIFQLAGLDPANSSTTIQVMMDILGVLTTCFVANFLLDSPLGKHFLHTIGGGHD